MAKKDLKVAFGTDGYERKKGGKTEHVRKYIKQIDIPTILAKEREKITSGKAKELIRKDQIYVGKIISELKQLKGSASSIPKNIAPDKDKGIYLNKFLQDIDKTIKKYEEIRKRNFDEFKEYSYMEKEED